MNDIKRMNTEYHLNILLAEGESIQVPVYTPKK